MATQRKAQSAQGGVVNQNKEVVDFLLELADYEKNVNRHQHKFNAYRKAAHTIAKCPTRITSGAEARKLEGVGDKIGKKIDEFMATGKLAKLEKIRADPRNTAIVELTSVAGIGPAAAAQLVKDGITSVAELEKHTDKLTHHQRVGLKHHADFKLRIPRAEMQELEAIVMDAAQSVDTNLQATICGSYRRGAQTSGDVDVLIAHPNFKSTSKVKMSPSPLKQLVDALRSRGFITDDISHGEAKFAGVCRRTLKSVKRSSEAETPAPESPAAKKIKLESGATTAAASSARLSTAVKKESEEAKGSDGATYRDDKAQATSTGSGDAEDVRHFRRLDIRLIPHDQYACGVLYFTGSDMFNKQMRATALDVGFTLNEYCLRPVGSTGIPGEPVAVATERDVFDAIGMDYREPSERNV